MTPPKDLNKLLPIPEVHILDGRHSSAQCWVEGCKQPVRYKMIIEEWPFNEGNYTTVYRCETHKDEYHLAG